MGNSTINTNLFELILNHYQLINDFNLDVADYIKKWTVTDSVLTTQNISRTINVLTTNDVVKSDTTNQIYIN